MIWYVSCYHYYNDLNTFTNLISMAEYQLQNSKMIYLLYFLFHNLFYFITNCISFFIIFFHFFIFILLINYMSFLSLFTFISVQERILRSKIPYGLLENISASSMGDLRFVRTFMYPYLHVLTHARHIHFYFYYL